MINLADMLGSPVLSDELSLVRAGRRAMATQFEVLLPVDQPLGIWAAGEALDLIDELEEQLTVYRDHSEISTINRTAFGTDLPVEPRLFDLLSFASALTHATSGAFDVAMGALIKAWGFYQRSGMVPTVAERSAAMQRTGMRYVILNQAARTARFLREGLQLNLGGIGKGYALDRAAELLTTLCGITSGLLHGGTSSVRAIGHPPGRPAGWMVSIKHPDDEGRVLGNVSLRNMALGTSAATYQYFVHEGKRLGHLLDPRRGWPAEGVRQASVVAPTAAEADALSTAFFVMKPDEIRIYCQQHPHIGAVILSPDAIEPIIWNLGPGQFTAAGR